LLQILSLTPLPTILSISLVPLYSARPMSNSCKMPLKAYLQCIRATEAFQKDPCDSRMEVVSQLPEVKEQCDSSFQTYKKCKEGTLDMFSRMRGNKALRS